MIQGGKCDVFILHVCVMDALPSLDLVKEPGDDQLDTIVEAAYMMKKVITANVKKRVQDLEQENAYLREQVKYLFGLLDTNQCM